MGLLLLLAKSWVLGEPEIYYMPWSTCDCHGQALHSFTCDEPIVGEGKTRRRHVAQQCHVQQLRSQWSNLGVRHIHAMPLQISSHTRHERRYAMIVDCRTSQVQNLPCVVLLHQPTRVSWRRPQSDTRTTQRLLSPCYPAYDPIFHPAKVSVLAVPLLPCSCLARRGNKRESGDHYFAQLIGAVLEVGRNLIVIIAVIATSITAATIAVTAMTAVVVPRLCTAVAAPSFVERLWEH